MKKIGPALWLGFVVSGCASSVPQVSASRPLVEATGTNALGSVLPDDLGNLLTESYSGQGLTYQQYQLLVGRKYVSALGQTCKEITVSEYAEPTEPAVRVVCEWNKQWRLMPKISDQSESEVFFEASN